MAESSTSTRPTQEAEQIHSDDSQESEEDEEQRAESSTAAAGKKKKKKKSKSKAARALGAAFGKNDKEIPQALVDTVLEHVKAENVPGATEESVREALDYLKINDVIRGKAGIAGRGNKDVGEHKFWATQPVTQAGEEVIEDGYIDEAVPADQVRQEPYPLPKDFAWSMIDLRDDVQLKEVYELLSGHYVEDNDASFRFQYTAPFLLWALKPPHYEPDWHIGVRVASNNKLVAFISGVPLTIRVRQSTFATVEINFLCVHKKLRSKRLAPVLIKEITRQCHMKGIFQAVYTGGVVIPTPVATCRYYHRPLNVPKLVDVKFTYVPRNMTVARMIRLNKLPDKPRLPIREVEERDLPGIMNLHNGFSQRYDLVQILSASETRHQFWSGRGNGEMVNGRRTDQVLWTYVVEDPDTKQVTDFFSFYTLPSSIINNTKHPVLDAAYLYYYASDVALSKGTEEEVNTKLKVRIKDLIQDALIIADKAKFDVFNGLTLMDNPVFLEDLRFGVGDGHLNFYLYNWRTAQLAGATSVGGRPAGNGVGLVMI